MSQDVAGLQFQIDSSQADPANERLALMARHAASVQSALGSMSRAASDSGGGFASFSSGAGRGIVQLAAFSSSLEGVVGQLQAARSALDGTVASFSAFETARQRADSLSTALGTSAVSLEAFTRQASVFNMTSFETAGALQRITAAIEGQTAAGRQLRALMQDYGVTLSGITASNADQVLTRFVQQVRSVQSSPQNAQALQSVLGTLDPGALASVQNPSLETVSAREARLRIQAVDRQVTALTDNASQVVARAQRTIGQTRDFEGTLTSTGSFNLGQLSSDQMQEVYRGMGRRADSGSVQDRMGIYNYLNSQAPDDLRNAARQAPSWFLPGGDYVPGVARLNYEYQGSRLQGFANQFSNGQFSSRMANVQAQAYNDYANNDHWYAAPEAALQYQLRTVGTFFGGDYTRQMPGDTRPISATQAFQQRQSGAAAVADLGFTDPMARVQADARLMALRRGGEQFGQLDTPGQIGAPRAAFSQVPEALSRLRGIYQSEGGMSPFDATQEADARYANAVDLAQVGHDQAMSPGAAGISQAATERWIMSMPPEQRGRARALLGFAQQQGVSTTRWAGRNMSMSDIAGGGIGGAGYAGGGTAGGFLSPSQSRGFDQLRSGQNGNDIAASNDATQTQLQLQRQLVMVIPEGSAAVQQQTAYWSAYNTAIASGNDGDVAKVKAQNAQREAIATTNTEMEKSLDLLKRRADADERSYAATSQAGTDPTARGVAGLNAGLANDVADLVSRGATPAQVTGYQTDRQRQFGIQAVQFGSDTEASSAQDLSVQRQLAAIAGSRLDTQRQLTHEIQTQRQFQPAINEAQASGDPNRLATVMKQMAAVVANMNAIDTTDLGAANLNSARDTNFHADSDVQYSTLAPADQHYTSGYDDWYSRNKSHPELAGKNAAAVMDLYLNPDKISDPGLQADTASTRNRIVGADTRSNADATNQSNMALSRSRAAAGAARGGSYASSIAGAGVSDPTNPQFGADYAGRQVAQVDASFAAQRASANADQTKQIQDNRDLSSAANESAGAYEKLKAQIDAVNQARRIGGSDIDGQARGNMALSVTEETKALTDQSLKLTDNIALQKARAAAYAQGIPTGQAFDRNSANFTQSQHLDQQVASGLTSPDDAAAQRAALARGGQQNQNSGFATSYAQFHVEDANRTRDNQLMQADISAGPFATPLSVSDAKNSVLAQRASDDSGGLTSYGDALQSLSQNDALKRQLDDVDALRSGMNQLGEATASSFESSIVHANTYRRSIVALGESVETSLIHTFVSRPLEKGLNTLMDTGLNSLAGALGFSGGSGSSSSSGSGGSNGGSGSGTTSSGGSSLFDSLGNWVSNGIMGQATKGLWGSLLGSAGMSSAATVPLADGIAGPVASASDAAGSGLMGMFSNWFATGGVIDQGIPTRYLASGGLIDRPTTFYAAGGTVMAGETGTEAIMPLKRLANGNLGIASTGGGGASPTVIVHAPVTIQGGGGGQGGGMSVAQQKQLQQQMVQVHTAAVRSVMANEMRNGGDLASNIGNNQ